MNPFSYKKAVSENLAISEAKNSPEACFIAGGTDVLNLMRERIYSPQQVIDLNPLPLNRITETDEGVVIGALTKMSEVADNSLIQHRYPVLVQAILESASPQLRNMATIGGNLLQRVRCNYFRDYLTEVCNKRLPGTGCAAKEGYNRSHAILGTSEHCIAVHPSDMAVALAALDGVVLIQGIREEKSIPLNDFYLLPGNTPEKENILETGDLIVAIFLPKSPPPTLSYYLKIRDRDSYQFALVSVAVVLETANKIIKSVKIALGGVATKPWRCWEAEEYLQDKPLTQENCTQAAELALKEAKPQSHNHFKVKMAKQAIIRTLLSSK